MLPKTVSGFPADPIPSFLSAFCQTGSAYLHLGTSEIAGFWGDHAMMDEWYRCRGDWNGIRWWTGNSVRCSHVWRALLSTVAVKKAQRMIKDFRWIGAGRHAAVQDHGKESPSGCCHVDDINHVTPSCDGRKSNYGHTTNGCRWRIWPTVFVKPIKNK